MLCDLSTDGALVLNATELQAGEQVILCWAGFEAFGSIRWSDGQLAGIGFQESLPWETVLASRQEQDERGFSAKAAEYWVQGSMGVDGNDGMLSV